MSGDTSGRYFEMDDEDAEDVFVPSSASPGCYLPIEVYANEIHRQLADNVRMDLINAAGLEEGSKDLEGAWRCIMHHIRQEFEGK